jgi:hypothetical protein
MTANELWLYVDEDVHGKLARELRERGVDAVSALEVGMEDVLDVEHLAFATSQARAVLTFNRGDFVQLHSQYMERGWEHFGIIVSPQYTIGETLRRVLNLTAALSADDMMNRLEYLSSWG